MPGCGNDGPPLRNLDAQGECIAILGDSLTAGHGLAPAQAYPALLAQRLGIPVVARGRDGDTTADGLARFDRDVPPLRPFLVVIQFGGNDFLHRVPQDETFRNIEHLVLKTHRLGAAAVVVAVDVDPIGDSYGNGYRNIATRHGAGVVTRFLRDVFGKPALMYDTIHPNARGHVLVTDRLAGTLEPILRRMPAAQRLRTP